MCLAWLMHLQQTAKTEVCHHDVTMVHSARFKVIVHAVPEGKLRMRRKAVTALAAHKQEGLHQLKDDPDEMLRGQAQCTPAFL